MREVCHFYAHGAPSCVRGLVDADLSVPVVLELASEDPEGRLFCPSTCSLQRTSGCLLLARASQTLLPHLNVEHLELSLKS